MIKAFTDEAWEDYLFWEKQDKKTLRKINRLIKDCERDPFTGLGKPEPLKHGYAGTWSRRINEKNRLIYKVENETLYFISLKDHYDDN